ncbi:hypothetical protein [Listeria booriae]|uniref:hypothetical protein n=1 Tax=Listeria booriae TaxID=1552123 RepID=UPI001624AF8D|nr:hypothetical protein [Listeria booriae]MBC2066997.1 hypothetical protein [Listeria booriae]
MKISDFIQPSAMSISDIIQLLAIIISLAVSIVAIRQTRKSLRITEQSIQDANRPYLAMYVESVELGMSISKYFVLKNFGNTSATILDISFNKELDILNKEFSMSSLINGTIAPGQKFSSSMDTKYKETIEVRIKYSDLLGNIYDEVTSIKTDMSSKLRWNAPKNSSDSNESTAIKQSILALIKSIK